MKKTSILGLSLLSLGLVVGLGTEAKAEEVTENGKTYWKVESGDTLSEIGAKYNLDFTNIHKVNKGVVADPNVIFVGDKLLLPLDENGKLVEQVNTTEPDIEVQYNEPVTPEQPVVVEQEVVEQPVVVAEAPAPVVEVPADSSSAKEWIAQRESSGSYDATNGQYIGRYQLSASYLNGDYSPANQERVADEYVAGRYGSWENAKSFWLANGWY
ncbi:peptidase M23 [Enterococcus phage phi EF14H1]|uniref:Peptidase M23 n=3 Tax=Kochikohdavirus TaxID=2560160 RepID=A0A7R7ER50_9CAUD|nr:aggregation promoting factor [Enterococcus phage vB_EfaM_Ef2.1]QVW28126.1 peptidoglycan-binding protein [Enterococcus phage MDA2]WDQ27642.1 aggregation promoting factor [Enterococcus phage 53]BBE37081.1 putative peptidoglycan-binding LysM [Enterococcus phage phiEF17H]BCN33083.1 peptidase M23 [Enterococcus phage phi EF7H]BCN33287.1 peptidase M23 [Enterococcus phage phi EF14H1]BCN33491.1 peptidase M23 [Enterococcus phage phi EF19G]